MNAEERLRRLLELLPEGASVTLTRTDIQALLGSSDTESTTGDVSATIDLLRPDQVAKAIGRSPSRVRDLRANGHFGNAKWNGHEHVTPRSDVDEYLRWRNEAYDRPKRKKKPSTPKAAPEGGAGRPRTDMPSAKRPAADTAEASNTDLSGWQTTDDESDSSAAGAKPRV